MSISVLPKVFFAYPSGPASSGDAIRQAAKKLNDSEAAAAQTWEDLSVGGRVLIASICNAIDEADCFVADLTGINPNVLFELGYAVAKKKRIWLLLDTSYEKSQNDFDSLRLFTTTGYVPYANSDDIVSKFRLDSPHYDLDNTLYKDLFEGRMPLAKIKPLFYLRSRVRSESVLRVDNFVESFNGALVDDPDESSAKSLTEYGQRVWQCQTLIAHLANPSRKRSLIDNSVHSLVAGLAHGWGRKLLLLVDGDYMTPADYRDMVKNYKNAKHAEEILKEWKSQIEWSVPAATKEQAVEEFTGDIRSLNLGQYVAEDEESDLVEKYFVDNKAYLDAYNGVSGIIVGKKGAGKTANLLKLKTELAKDKRNIVVTIKPLSYEISGLVSLLSKLHESHSRGHVLQNMWVYLIYTEVAKTLAERLKQRISAVHSDSERFLVQMYDDNSASLRESFSIRLETAVDRLTSELKGMEGDNHEMREGFISEALHKTLLRDIKHAVFSVLSSKNRVTILLDNLDKAWDQSASLEQLSSVFLSLFSVINNLKREFQGGIDGAESGVFSMVLFARADIFVHVLANAREPDKIPYRVLQWTDCESLLLIAEERYRALSSDEKKDSFWSRYFQANIGDVPLKQFICDNIRHRPRDLLYLLSKSMEVAVNRQHVGVLAEDMVKAAEEYSRFAFDSLLVENGISIEKLEEILFGFIGESSVLSEENIFNILSASGLGKKRIDYVLMHLIKLGFFGLEIRKDVFSFPDDIADLKRELALSKKFNSTSMRRYAVHSAYRRYLGMDD